MEWLWWLRKLFSFLFVNRSWQLFMLHTRVLVPWTNVQQILYFDLVSQSTSLEPGMNALITTTLRRYSLTWTSISKIYDCTYMGINYLVFVDRYSNWPIVFLKENGRAADLIHCLRHISTTFGTPEELTTDGGPQFTTGLPHILSSWGVHHRLVSVGNTHANPRAEISVKTIKRMLMVNTG